MILLAALAGYAIGSIPTAGALGRIWGVDLRADGGNPGANNAWRRSGLTLALVVLLIEASKGLLAVMVGSSIGGDGGAVAAGLGAVAGNVYNLWYRLDGGKGLSISAGVLLGLWPLVVGPILAIVLVTSLATHSSGFGALASMAVLNLAAVLWWAFDWPVAWGLDNEALLVTTAVGMTAILVWKHLADVSLSQPLPG